MINGGARQIWEAALGQLQLQVSKANYSTWLKDTVLVSAEDDLYVIGAPTSFATEWLENRLHSLVKKTLISIVGRSVDIRFVVYQPQTGSNNPAPRRGRGRPRASASEEGLLKHQNLGFGGGASQHDQNTGHSSLQLNPRYTFDTFIVGKSNRLPHAAALAAAEQPGSSYNPLFIYGGVGLGKTHLLHAIGHVASEQGKHVLYISTEQFTNELINAIRERRNEEFRAKYRSAHLLLIDDIQFIAGKEQTQEEFFHTFNALHSAGHQIVMSSDRSPKSMPTLEDRLRSRFEWGLIADIQPPDLETRAAILRTKADAQGERIPSDVLDFIAQKVQTNIRELEGCLNRIIAYARVTHSELSIQVASDALNDMFASGGKRRSIAPSQIIGAVAKYYGVEMDDLTSKKRDRDIALPRQIAMHIMREETEISLVEIGQLLGGRDHTTVMYGCEKIASEINTTSRLRREVMEIKESLYVSKRE